LESENARLRDKLKKAATFIQRVNLDADEQEVREDYSQLQRALREKEAEIERLERELSSRQKVGGQPANHREDEISNLRQALRQAQSNIEYLTAENRKLESRGGVNSEIQNHLERLRLENDRLRKDTIDMLRSVESTRNRESKRVGGGFDTGSVSPRYGPSYNR